MQPFKHLSLLFSGILSLSFASFSYAVTDFDLAFHYAPVHYQDTDSTDYPADYITAIDYDFDWIATNNWDNLSSGQWPAAAYYSVVESCTHYFITYSFFHPRDWTDIPFDQEHENDLEGLLMVVRKNGSTYGALEGMITVFHNDFFSFTPSGSPLSNGNENIDGVVSFEYYQGVNRAKTVQEAKGHGLKAWPYASDFDGGANQDGIIYYPTTGAGNYPTSGNDRHVDYRLVDVFTGNGLWTHALNDAPLSSANADTFNQWGNFKGDTGGGCGAGWPTCKSNGANTPWGWDDHDDGGSYAGEFALDPANLVDHYFNGLGQFSQHYVRNRYLSDMQAAGYSSSYTPRGFSSDLALNTMYQKLSGTCN